MSAIPCLTTNPGETLAGCALFALAARRDPDLTGWFDVRAGRFRFGGPVDWSAVLGGLSDCRVTPDLPAEAVARLEAHRSRTPGTGRVSPAQREQIVVLEEAERAAAVRFGPPLDVRLDWWLPTEEDADESGVWLAGDVSPLKTWAGHTRPVAAAAAFLQALPAGVTDPATLLAVRATGPTPLYLDSNLAGSANALDVGFSLDIAGLKPACRPLVELLAFVGLQWFRPAQIGHREFQYRAWTEPATLGEARLTFGGHLDRPGSILQFQPAFRDPQGYRKAFTVAHPIGAVHAR